MFLLLADGSLIAYLVERQLLDEADIVDGNITVVDVSRRNRDLRITTNRHTGYFAKQGLDAERRKSVKREAAFLTAAAQTNPLSGMSRHLPVVRAWDENAGVLIFNLVPDARSLDEHHHRFGRHSVTIAGDAGRVLGLLHSRQGQALFAGCANQFDRDPPWALSIHRPGPRLFDRFSGSSIETVRIVQNTPSLAESLESMRQAWQPSTVIHGDVRWENLLLSRSTTGQRGFHVILVDWEMVQLGDPLWDAACFLSQYLSEWIASMPAGGDGSQSPLIGVQVPLETLKPAMRQFWEGYTEFARPANRAARAAIERLARYTAAGLLQSTIEAGQQDAALSGTGAIKLQVAQNMLVRPADAANALLGLATYD